MSAAKRIQFETTIKAPAEVVWNTMLGDESYRRWTSAFMEGSYYEGTWEEGTRMKFLAPPGDGMISEIAENRPNEFLSIRHIGMTAGGVEDTESESVRSWAPAYENYSLSEVPGGTRVVIDQDVADEFEQFMLDTWPKALESLKRLCEEQGAAA